MFHVKRLYAYEMVNIFNLRKLPLHICLEADPWPTLPALSEIMTMSSDMFLPAASCSLLLSLPLINLFPSFLGWPPSQYLKTIYNLWCPYIKERFTNKNHCMRGNLKSPCKFSQTLNFLNFRFKTNLGEIKLATNMYIEL